MELTIELVEDVVRETLEHKVLRPGTFIVWQDARLIAGDVRKALENLVDDPDAKLRRWMKDGVPMNVSLEAFASGEPIPAPGETVSDLGHKRRRTR